MTSIVREAQTLATGVKAPTTSAKAQTFKLPLRGPKGPPFHHFERTIFHHLGDCRKLLFPYSRIWNCREEQPWWKNDKWCQSSFENLTLRSVRLIALLHELRIRGNAPQFGQPYFRIDL